MNACQVFVLGMAVVEQSCFTRDGPADPVRHLARVTVSRKELHLTVGGRVPAPVRDTGLMALESLDFRVEPTYSIPQRREQSRGGGPISVSAGTDWLHVHLCQARGLLCPLTTVVL